MINRINRNSLLKLILILFALVFIAAGLSFLFRQGSMTLEEYALKHPGQPQDNNENRDSVSSDRIPSHISSNNAGTTISTNNAGTTVSANNAGATVSSNESVSGELMGKRLNADSMIGQRIVYTDDFYYEPLSDALMAAMEGISYPAFDSLEEEPAVAYEDLRYVHLLHYDFHGNVAEGELICNASVAQDFVEIFHTLYQNMYRIEKILLIDVYGGDDTASMEDNNTSCFNYRTVEGSTSLSKHALGLAIDINPFYNPYVTYPEGQVRISPRGSEIYADRSREFPYKIDENDLCYKLFTERGFLWGGNWNSMKDYQHFQKIT